jgi:DNA invertase Pin-like site-specific DNA recombinase
LGGYSKLLHLGAASLLLDDLPATGKKLPRYPIVPADMDDGRVVLLRRVAPATDAIDTGTPSGRFFFHVMASLAEMERELIVERTRAGLDVARQLGRKGGRKPKMTDSKIEPATKLLSIGVPPKDVAKNLGVSIPTPYRWVPASAQAY